MYSWKLKIFLSSITLLIASDNTFASTPYDLIHLEIKNATLKSTGTCFPNLQGYGEFTTSFYGQTISSGKSVKVDILPTEVNGNKFVALMLNCSCGSGKDIIFNISSNSDDKIIAKWITYTSPPPHAKGTLTSTSSTNSSNVTATVTSC